MKRTKIMQQISCLLLILLLTLGIASTAFAVDGCETTVRLSEADISGNIPFSITNMFPGDSVSKDFIIEVSHKRAITLYYHADIRPGFEVLAEVLNLKIELPNKGETLYNGLIRDMPNSVQYGMESSEQSLIYRITVYLDTSVGNINEIDTDGRRYMYQELTADFRWWYLEEPGSAEIKLAAEKVLDGQYPRGSAFTFLLQDDSGNTVQTVKNTDGLIEFSVLHFKNSGTYIYYISEQTFTDSKISYDPVRYKVEITVMQEGSFYQTTVSYERDGKAYATLPRFVNTTKGSPGEPDEPIDPDKPYKPDNPKTGDESNIELYIELCAVSMAGLLLLLFFKRKKEDAGRE